MTDNASVLTLLGSLCCCLAVFLLAMVIFAVAFRPRRARGADVVGLPPAPSRGVATQASLTRMEALADAGKPVPGPARPNIAGMVPAAPPAAPPASTPAAGAPAPASASPAAKPAPASAVGPPPVPSAGPPPVPGAPPPAPSGAPPIPTGARLLTPSVTIAPGSGEAPSPPAKKV